MTLILFKEKIRHLKEKNHNPIPLLVRIEDEINTFGNRSSGLWKAKQKKQGMITIIPKYIILKELKTRTRKTVSIPLPSHGNFTSHWEANIHWKMSG